MSSEPVQQSVQQQAQQPVDGVAEPMRSRWSPSSFDPGHVLADPELDGLLEAARWAPSRGNSQPWVMVVVRRDGRGYDGLCAALSRGNAWVTRASAVLVVCVRTAPDPGSGADARVPAADYACYGAGLAAAHVVLQATATGLHAHQFSGMDLDAVGSALDVPAHFRVLAGIAVGRHLPPATSPEPADDRGPDLASLAEREERPRERRDPATAARDGAWGHGWTPSGARG